MGQTSNGGRQAPPRVEALRELQGALAVNREARAGVLAAELRATPGVVVSKTLRLPPGVSALNPAQRASLPAAITFSHPLPTIHTGPFECSAPSVETAPECWLALGDRYVFHLGTSKVWDSWGSEWCNLGWRPRFNMPRVSVVLPAVGGVGGVAGAPTTGRDAHRAWLTLWALLGPHVPLPANRPSGWVLSFPSALAQTCILHERRWGAGSAPVNALALLWVRHGRPNYNDCSPLTASWGCVRRSDHVRNRTAKH